MCLKVVPSDSSVLGSQLMQDLLGTYSTQKLRRVAPTALDRWGLAVLGDLFEHPFAAALDLFAHQLSCPLVVVVANRLN